VKIVCGFGTAVRFAVMCIALGMVLGFALATQWHRVEPGPAAVPSSQARVGPELDVASAPSFRSGR
jgi:hypothetical protein